VDSGSTSATLVEVTAAQLVSDTGHVTDMSRVTIRELARHMTEVLERVAAGETVEITRNGIPVAVISAPDPVEAKMLELVETGVLPRDWQEERTELSTWLAEHPPLRTEPGTSLSDELIKLRQEERS
jgi:prevent-host-death family protein